jgi:hypothetical protein
MSTNDPWAVSASEAQPTETPLVIRGTLGTPPIVNIPDIWKRLDTATNENTVYDTLKYISQLPAEQIINVLGAGERIESERLSNLKSNPAGVAATTASPLLGPVVAMLFANGRKEIGNEVYAAFHPNDPNIETASEKAAGVDKLISQDPRFRGKLQNFIVRTTFQNLKDPLNWATLGTAAGGEMFLRGLGRVGTAALKNPNDLIRGTAKMALTNTEERAGGFSEQEIAKVNTYRNREQVRARVQHTEDEALLHKYRPMLERGVVPDAVRQRLLHEPYVYGTPEMRRQAEAFGYHPTGKEQDTPPQGLLDYNLREDYDPHTGVVGSGNFEDLLLGQTSEKKTPTAGFEKQQTGEAAPESLPDRIAKRLAAGRSVVRHRATARAMEENLGVGHEMANSLAKDGEDVGGFPLGQALSKAQVDAMLATGVPHMRNVGVMGWNALGELGLAKALQRTVVPDKNLLSRLEQGGSSHFGIRTPGKLSPARLVPLPVRKATTGLLDRWDQALRSTRLEQLDKEHPEWAEEQKLDRVNQDLGAYNLKPHYVKVLQSIGANFPQWHNYVVPTSVARAMIRHPGRVARLSRAEENANDSFLPNAPFRVTLGGPNDEFASMAADPANVAVGKGAKYLLSPSSVGPLASNLLPQSFNAPWKQRLAETLSNFVPTGSTILDETLNPYKSPLKPLARGAAGLSGVYTQKRPPQSLARTAGQQTVAPIAPAASANPNDPWAVGPAAPTSPSLGKPPAPKAAATDPWAAASPSP